MLLTRSPLYSRGCPRFLVRLACVRHAASVDSEPGSNSRLKPDIGRSLRKGIYLSCEYVARHRTRAPSLATGTFNLLSKTVPEPLWADRFGLTDFGGTSPLPSVLESFKHTAITERCQPEWRPASPTEIASGTAAAKRARYDARRGAVGFWRAKRPARNSQKFKRSIGGLATLREPCSRMEVPEWDRFEVAKPCSASKRL